MPGAAYWLDDEEDDAPAAAPASVVVPVVAVVPAAPVVAPAVVSVVAPAAAPGAGTAGGVAASAEAETEAESDDEEDAALSCFLWCLPDCCASDMAGMAIMAVTMAAAEAIWMKDFITKPFQLRRRLVPAALTFRLSRAKRRRLCGAGHFIITSLWDGFSRVFSDVCRKYSQNMGNNDLEMRRQSGEFPAAG